MKNTYLKNLLNGILFDFVFIFVCLFLYQIVSITIECLKYSYSIYDFSRTPHLIWFVLTLAPLIIMLIKIKADLVDFFNFLFFIMLVSLFIHIIISKYAPKSFLLKEDSFVGVYGIDDYEMSDENGVDHDKQSLTKGQLYNQDDQKIKTQIDQIEKQHNRGANTKGFMFWQSGFIEGYGTDFINTNGVMSSEFKFYLKIGPVIIYECFLRAIQKFCFVFLISILFRIFKRSLFFKDLPSLLKRLAN